MDLSLNLYENYQNSITGVDKRVDNIVKKALNYIIVNRKKIFVEPYTRAIPAKDGYCNIKVERSKDGAKYNLELGMQSASYIIKFVEFPLGGKTWITGIKVFYKTNEYPESETAKYRKIMAYSRHQEKGKKFVA